MKKLLLLLLLLPVWANGQEIAVTDSLPVSESDVYKTIHTNVAGSLNAHALAAITSQRVLFGPGAPTGTCPTGKLWLRTSNGFIYGCAAGTWVLAGGGAPTPGGSTGDIQYNNAGALGGSLLSQSTNTIEQKNGANAQQLKLYNTYTDASNNEPLIIGFSSNEAVFNMTKAGTGTNRNIRINAGAGFIAFSLANTTKWYMDGTTASLLAGADGGVSIGSTGAARPASIFLQAPAITIGSGTGITVVNSGEPRELVYKVTILNTALSAAATTADVTLATLPAKTQLNGIWADVTQVFTGGAVATATMTCGKSAGGAEYLASFNVFSATIQRGLVDADLGTAMVRAAAVQGGDMPSWSATTVVQCRLTTTGANTNALAQGSVTFYLRTTKLP